jgi:hypothetical protein
MLLITGHWVRRPPVHPEAGLVFYWKDLGSDEGFAKRRYDIKKGDTNLNSNYFRAPLALYFRLFIPLWSSDDFAYIYYVSFSKGWGQQFRWFMKMLVIIFKF